MEHAHSGGGSLATNLRALHATASQRLCLKLAARQLTSSHVAFCCAAVLNCSLGCRRTGVTSDAEHTLWPCWHHPADWICYALCCNRYRLNAAVQRYLANNASGRMALLVVVSVSRLWKHTPKHDCAFIPVQHATMRTENAHALKAC